MQQLAAIGGPVLVQVGGQQLAAVPTERLLGEPGIALCDGFAGELFEAHGVDRDVGVGKQPDEVVAKHDGVVAPGRTTGEVGGLVQPRRRAHRRLVRPEQVHHRLAVEAVTRCQCEDLDERRGAPSRPSAIGGGDAVDRDGEATEQGDLDEARRPAIEAVSCRWW